MTGYHFIFFMSNLSTQPGFSRALSFAQSEMLSITCKTKTVWEKVWDALNYLQYHKKINNCEWKHSKNCNCRPGSYLILNNFGTPLHYLLLYTKKCVNLGQEWPEWWWLLSAVSMLLSDCQSLTLNVMIWFYQFVKFVTNSQSLCLCLHTSSSSNQLSARTQMGVTALQCSDDAKIKSQSVSQRQCH